MLNLRDATLAENTSASATLLAAAVWPVSQEIVAGRHTFRYNYSSEIRFGPALFSVEVEGPNGETLSKWLNRYPLLAPRAPWQSELGWFALVEWRGDILGHGSSAVTVIDLERGERVSTQVLKPGSFQGWISSKSREYLIQEFVDRNSCDWFATDARTGAKRFLFRGGFEGYVSGCGAYLIAVRMQNPPEIALVSIGEAQVLDTKNAADFRMFAPDALRVDTVSFDPALVRLVCMLNWSKTDLRTGTAEYERLIAAEIADAAS